jgi:hypothetical protein
MPHEDISDRMVEALDKARANIEEGKMLFECHVEGIQHGAKLLKVRYDALVEVGFTQDQATAIIIQRGLC